MDANRTWHTASVWRRPAMAAAILAVAVLLPLVFLGSQYNLSLLTTVVLYGVLTSAWNLIGGMAGQLDLSAGAYLGLGAFTTGTLLLRWNVTPWVGMFAGGMVAVGFAFLVGFPLFRFGIREVWYALSSSALVVVLQVVFTLWKGVGGSIERVLPFYAFSLYHLRFGTYLPFYYIMMALLLVTLWTNHRIRTRRLGYYLLALGDNEDAAEALGVDARGSKLKALMAYAFIVGITGGLYACMYGFIHPSFFSPTISMEVAILGIIGGMGITYGPLLATVVLVTGRELLRASLGGRMESLYLVIYAVVLITIALLRPRGLASLIQDAVDRAKLRDGRQQP
ncbi:MAG: branched-chain amino acid ABC transporter permease [Spirochaetia bacterium]